MARTFISTSALTYLIRLFIVFCCFPVHECAHAWVAEKLGDPTGRNLGRITLNPFAHLDLWGTIAIFIFGVGYAKPVPVNTRNFRNRKWDFAVTALAGPVSNLVMAAIFMAIIKVLSGSITDAAFTARQILAYAASVNISLAIFNLIPIPPLDGSRILTAALPDRAYDAVQNFERYSMYILLILFFFNRSGFSPISAASQQVFSGMARIFGLM